MSGWLNVDVRHSDHDVDLARAPLPWADDVFDVVVSQHFIEHLELETELLPLLHDLRRVLKPGGAMWISCPDLEKVCRSYLEHDMEDLLADRQVRVPEYDLGDVPVRHMINNLFHAEGKHKNLYDLELLRWALVKAGFRDVVRVEEADLLRRFPSFPPRMMMRSRCTYGPGRVKPSDGRITGRQYWSRASSRAIGSIAL